MRFLLDTNVVSQIGKPNADRNVLRWLGEMPEAETAISAITVREVWYGWERMRLERNLSTAAVGDRLRMILDAYAPRILPVDERVARVWATMLADWNKHTDDTALAATAAVHGLVVVTRNLAHLRGRGVPLLDPFRSPPIVVPPAT